MKLHHQFALALILLATAVLGQVPQPVMRSHQGVRLTAVQRDDAILLKWQMVPGADRYRIYYQRGSELQNGAAQVDVDGSQTSYLFGDVASKAIYTFRVVPLGGGEEGTASPSVTVTLRDKSAAAPSDRGK